MKFYSEKLNQVFDTPEQLEEAEKNVKSVSKKRAIKEQVSQEVVDTQTPTKKQLAADVEAADDKLKEAYANYEAARTRVEELSKKYLEETKEILDPAAKAVKDAEKARYAAIRKFNDSFGAYQVTYTGARAADEMLKAINNLNERSLLKNLFWF